MYDVVKTRGVWRIRSLSPCFPPVVVTGAEYPTKAKAYRAARTAAGADEVPIKDYIAAVESYKKYFNL